MQIYSSSGLPAKTSPPVPPIEEVLLSPSDYSPQLVKLAKFVWGLTWEEVIALNLGVGRIDEGGRVQW